MTNPNSHLPFWIFDSASPETDITSALFNPGEIYDVKDLSPSFDGRKLAFAMRGPIIEGVDEDDESQPKWNIWEYDLTAGGLPRRVIRNSALEEGWHDVSPRYLPGDQRMVFSSNRQFDAQSIQLGESVNEITAGAFSALVDTRDEDIGEAFVLHTMNSASDLIDANGQSIRQITYNQSHDLKPTVLKNGKIIFLRWDAAEGLDQLSLYSVNPDGSDMNFLYGYHSQDTGLPDTSMDLQTTFFDLAEMPDGRILAVLKHRDNSDADNNFPVLGGDIIAIDTDNFTEIDQPAPSGQTSIAPVATPLVEGLSEVGYYNSAYPIDDGTNRILVTWTPCLIASPTGGNPLFCTSGNLTQNPQINANPSYGLWVYNPNEQTLRPILIPSKPGEIITDIISLEAKTGVASPFLAISDTSGYGTLNIRSIYDFSGVAENTFRQWLIQRKVNLVPVPPVFYALLKPSVFLEMIFSTLITMHLGYLKREACAKS